MLADLLIVAAPFLFAAAVWGGAWAISCGIAATAERLNKG